MNTTKTIQRSVAAVLVLLLVLAVFPASVFAEEPTEAAEPESSGEYLTGIHTFTGYSLIDPRLGISMFADTGNMNWYGMYQIQTRDREINYFTYTAANGTSITANLRTITRMYMDGVVAYCIRPGTHVEDGGSYSEDEQIMEWQTYLNDAQRQAIATVVALGYPMQTFTDGTDNGIYAFYGDSKSEWQTSERYAATQILIWEFLMGHRSPEYPYTLDTSKTSSSGRTLLETFYSASDNYAKWPTMIKVYNEILDAMKRAAVYPSFMAKNTASAQSVELTYNASTGKYEASLTNANKVLSDYTFACSNSGVTLTKSGNTLKISATAQAAASMSSSPVTVTASGTALSIDPEEALLVWYAPSGSQEVITPVESSVTLENRPEEGSISVKKVDTQGNAMSGVKFRLDYSTDGQNWKPVTKRDAGSAVTVGGCTSAGLTDGCLTADGNGLLTFSGLRISGQTGKVYYRLTECSTNDGSSLLAEPAYEGELPMDGSKDITVTAVNSDVFELPHTGSNSMVLLQFAQLLCFVCCLGLLLIPRKKEQ